LLQKLIKDALFVCTGGTVLFAGISVYQGREKFYRQYVMPFFQLFDAETSHRMAVKAAKYKLVPKPRKPVNPILVCYILRLHIFSSPCQRQHELLPSIVR
jgi:hypothetical protein